MHVEAGKESLESTADVLDKTRARPKAISQSVRRYHRLQ